MDPSVNPGLHDGRPAINHLSHGTVTPDVHRISVSKINLNCFICTLEGPSVDISVVCYFIFDKNHLAAKKKKMNELIILNYSVTEFHSCRIILRLKVLKNLLALRYQL
jgi:hypothetical protein